MNNCNILENQAKICRAESPVVALIQSSKRDLRRFPVHVAQSAVYLEADSGKEDNLGADLTTGTDSAALTEMFRILSADPDELEALK